MNLTAGLSEQARTRPDAAAIVHNGRIVSYGRLDALTWHIAAWFRARGVAAGDVVGMTLSGSLTHLLAAFALARMGALQLSLPPFEPVALRRELALRSGARLVVGDGASAAEPGLPVLRPDPSWLAADGAAAVDPTLADPGGERPWAIVASSGTTGRPKLFPYRHATELLRARRLYPRLADRPGMRMLRLAPVSFIASKRSHLSWIGAGHVSVLESGAVPPDYEAIIRTVRERAVDLLIATPLQVEQLLAHCPPGTRRMPGLRILLTGTTVVAEPLRRAARERIAPRTLVNYGSNEVGIMTLAEPEDQERHPGTIGRAMDGIEIQIVDPEDRPLPCGEVGLIRLRGEGMAGSRYLDDPAADARSWRDGWYRPGDLGALTADGNLIFHGRVDEVINRDGLKIYPAEIETVLLAHPAVAEAAAFAVIGTAQQQMPLAAVVLSRPIDAAALLAHAQAALGPRAPQRVLILPSLPRNSFGKVLRRELQRLVAAEAPGAAGGAPA